MDHSSNFKIYVQDPGLYRLEIFHHKFSFEPVIIDVISDVEISQNSALNQYSAYISTLNTGQKS